VNDSVDASQQAIPIDLAAQVIEPAPFDIRHRPTRGADDRMAGQRGNEAATQKAVSTG
jgi:hypothetical protein